MNIDDSAVTRLLPVSECIVEERVWLHGAEVVSHLNYSQLARVRSSRALPSTEFTAPLAMPFSHDEPEHDPPVAKVA